MSKKARKVIKKTRIQVMCYGYTAVLPSQGRRLLDYERKASVLRPVDLEAVLGAVVNVAAEAAEGEVS